MKTRTLASSGHAALLALALGSIAHAEATKPVQPGGKLPGNVAIQLVKVADGLVEPVHVDSPKDGTNRVFVCERPGVVRLIKDGKLQRRPFLDIQQTVVSSFLEQGLYDIAFHPKFKENGLFYVHYSDMWFNGDGFIVEYKVKKDNPDQADPESARVVMHLERPYCNHNGGEIVFGPDGYLYIGSGDGGWEGDVLNAGQDLSTTLGKVLRIDVDTRTTDKGYGIPKDNPFITPLQQMTLFGISEETFSKIHPKAAPEIWSYGIRNPWTMCFDGKTGDFYIFDVGQNHWEEIHYQPASSKGGENYGWNKMQGSWCHPTLSPAQPCSNFGVLPAGEYPHEVPFPGAPPLRTGHGCSIEGLGVANYGGMNGVYLAGDWCTGRLFGLGWDGRRWQLEEMLHTNLQFTAGGNGEDGYVYAVNCNCFYTADRGPMGNPPGALWRIVPVSEVKPGQETALTVQQISQTTGPAGTGAAAFRHPLTNQPVKLDKYPNETVTAKVLQFHKTGKNPYTGDKEAIAQGRAAYDQWCAACHLADGTGRIGSNLTDAQVTYPRVANDIGMFEAIYAGASGAMQAFGNRLTQDEILRMMAFIETLKKK